MSSCGAHVPSPIAAPSTLNECETESREDHQFATIGVWLTGRLFLLAGMDYIRIARSQSTPFFARGGGEEVACGR